MRTEPAPFRTIDARDWLPPEPMEAVLAALPELDPGRELVLLLYREPFPLYRVLEARGFVHRTVLHPDGTFAIHVRRA